MTTLLFVFIVALVLALVTTPLVRLLALRYGLVHEPSERCVHNQAIPRIGGVALFCSFFLALILCLPFHTSVSLLLHDSRIIALFTSAALIFLMGLGDDLRPLPFSVKLLIQLAAALIAWYGGIRINVLSLSLTGGAELGWLSLPITIFWIVFVTNAINLIDGLDGLAAGICFFASLVMLMLCITSDRILIALLFSALSGTLLGFLRYNFNPASIFMGDCGSYFLGYTFATLSVLGSVKGQTTVAMLIPFIALGVPLFDTILSPVRRFARGRNMFSPDSSHLHHRLLQDGRTQRQAVLLLYVATLVLGGAAFTLILVKDEKAGLILLIPVLAIFFAFKKLGYLDYLAIDKIYGWLRDISESSHISSGSRTFLDHQITIKKAQSLEELWSAAGQTFAFVGLDQAVLELKTNIGSADRQPARYEWTSSNSASAPESHTFRASFPLIYRARNRNKIGPNYDTWLGTFTVSKDLTTSPVSQFALRRIEQLKSDLVDKIAELQSQHDESYAFEG